MVGHAPISDTGKLLVYWGFKEKRGEKAVCSELGATKSNIAQSYSYESEAKKNAGTSIRVSARASAARNISQLGEQWYRSTGRSAKYRR